MFSTAQMSFAATEDRAPFGRVKHVSDYHDCCPNNITASEFGHETNHYRGRFLPVHHRQRRSGPEAQAFRPTLTIRVRPFDDFIAEANFVAGIVARAA